MTSETPCLPGCGPITVWNPSGRVTVEHWPNCPNTPKPAEPPACEHEWGSMMVCARCHTYRRPAAPPQDAEPPACESSLDGFEPIGFQPIEPQGEPPIDFESVAKWASGIRSTSVWSGVARAYLSLKAEWDALKAENAKNSSLLALHRMRHTDLLDENAALKARVEEIRKATRRVNLAAFDLYSDILPAAKALEEILNRKEQEASNDPA